MLLEDLGSVGRTSIGRFHGCASGSRGLRVAATAGKADFAPDEWARIVASSMVAGMAINPRRASTFFGASLRQGRLAKPGGEPLCIRGNPEWQAADMLNRGVPGVDLLELAPNRTRLVDLAKVA